MGDMCYRVTRFLSATATFTADTCQHGMRLPPHHPWMTPQVLSSVLVVYGVQGVCALGSIVWAFLLLVWHGNVSHLLHS